MIKLLSEAAKVSEDVVKKWLVKQLIWEIYLPTLRRIPRPKFDVSAPNAVHEAPPLLFIPHDKLGHKVFKYVLTVADVASRNNEVEPLTSKNSDELAQAFQRIYKRGLLKWPQMLQVDPGPEFIVTKEMENHKITIWHGHAEIHHDQAIVERYNRILAERLFSTLLKCFCRRACSQLRG